jgi:hypothetical protein
MRQVQLDSWLKANCKQCFLREHYPDECFFDGTTCPHYKDLTDPSMEDFLEPDFYNLKSVCPMRHRIERRTSNGQ